MGAADGRCGPYGGAREAEVGGGVVLEAGQRREASIHGAEEDRRGGRPGDGEELDGVEFAVEGGEVGAEVVAAVDDGGEEAGRWLGKGSSVEEGGERVGGGARTGAGGEKVWPRGRRGEKKEKGRERIRSRDLFAKEKGPEGKVEGPERKKGKEEEDGCKTQGVGKENCQGKP